MPPKSKKAKKATKTPVLDKSKVEFFCGKCEGYVKEEEEVKKDADKSISCEKCAKWFHQPCTDLTPEDMEYMRKKAKASVVWLCIDCIESGSGERARMSNLEKTINNQNLQLNKLMEMFGGMREKVIEEVSVILESKFEQKLRDFTSNFENKIKDTNKTLDSKMTEKMEERVEELEEREKRALNLILFNIPESKATTRADIKEEDTKTADNIFRSIVDIDEGEILEATRLGKKLDNGNPRCLQIRVKNLDTKKDILRNAKYVNKRETPKEDRIYINADHTPAERAHHKKLRAELKERLSKGETGLYIRNKQIVKSTTDSSNLNENSNSSD